MREDSGAAGTDGAPLLTDLLIVERIGKQGRSYLYRICEIE